MTSAKDLVEENAAIPYGGIQIGVIILFGLAFESLFLLFYYHMPEVSGWLIFAVITGLLHATIFWDLHQKGWLQRYFSNNVLGWILWCYRDHDGNIQFCRDIRAIASPTYTAVGIPLGGWFEKPGFKGSGIETQKTAKVFMYNVPLLRVSKSRFTENGGVYIWLEDPYGSRLECPMASALEFVEFFNICSDARSLYDLSAILFIQKKMHEERSRYYADQLRKKEDECSATLLKVYKLIKNSEETLVAICNSQRLGRSTAGKEIRMRHAQAVLECLFKDDLRYGFFERMAQDRMPVFKTAT